MIQEDKQLLLTDICARLPYGVIVHYKSRENEGDAVLNYGNVSYVLRLGEGWWIDCKPYLRPMSSMTDEEYGELSNIIGEWFNKELFLLTEEPSLEYALWKINYSISPMLFDWLNKKMFDYRGLISKCQAISTEEFNPYED